MRNDLPDCVRVYRPTTRSDFRWRGCAANDLLRRPSNRLTQHSHAERFCKLLQCGICLPFSSSFRRLISASEAISSASRSCFKRENKTFKNKSVSQQQQHAKRKKCYPLAFAFTIATRLLFGFHQIAPVLAFGFAVSAPVAIPLFRRRRPTLSLQQQLGH